MRLEGRKCNEPTCQADCQIHYFNNDMLQHFVESKASRKRGMAAVQHNHSFCALVLVVTPVTGVLQVFVKPYASKHNVLIRAAWRKPRGARGTQLSAAGRSSRCWQPDTSTDCPAQSATSQSSSRRSSTSCLWMIPRRRCSTDVQRTYALFSTPQWCSMLTGWVSL